MKRQIVVFVMFLGLLFSLASCDPAGIYDEYVTIAKKGWYKEEAARFEVLITDTLQPVDFYLNIRNDAGYRYSNLYLFLITKFPNGNITRDTIECILADREGRWLGKGWGPVKENSVLLSKQMLFPLKGKYEFLIQQAMRTDTLKGICNIGIRISRPD